MGTDIHSWAEVKNKDSGKWEELKIDVFPIAYSEEKMLPNMEYWVDYSWKATYKECSDFF